jgi:leucyl aminopeptidase
MKMTVALRPTLTTRLVFCLKEEGADIPDFSGDAGEVTVRYEKANAVTYCGLGEKKKCTPAIIRSAAAKGVNRIIDIKRTSLSLLLPAANWCGRAGMDAAMEGALLGAYRFTRYKSEKPVMMDRIEFVGHGVNAAGLLRVRTLGDAVWYARDLVNENASVMTPVRLAAEARALGRKSGLRVTVLDEKAIARKGLHLLAAVGQGSPTPPRLMFIEYTGDRASKKWQAIAGKGITFDSGGQNLKPTGSIETMRSDMAGAAAVLATMKAVAALKPRANVIGCIAAAHNALDGKAYFPGDIYPSFAGKTVEINSTDAEGRLVLADALACCIKTYRPERIVDLATLTGSVIMALGDIVAGLYANDDGLAGALFASGERTGERIWRFPLYQEYRDSLKSDFADLRNLSKFKKGYAGSITGAAFIQEFVGETPWAHLDIAGTAWNEGGARGEVPQYATGFGVRLLVDFLTAE